MTAYTGPTPYDAEIEEAKAEAQGITSKLHLRVVMGKVFRVEAKAEGYRRGRTDAKAEDAALLEALKVAYNALLYGDTVAYVTPEGQRTTALRWVETAIAQYEGKE